MIRNSLIGFYNELGSVGLSSFVYLFYLMVLLSTIDSYRGFFPWIIVPILVIPFNARFVSIHDRESAIFTANASVALFLWILNAFAPFDMGEAFLAVIVLLFSGMISLMNSSGIGKGRVIQLILPTLVLSVLFVSFLLLGKIRTEELTSPRLSFIKDINNALLFFFCLIRKDSAIQRNRYMIGIGLRSSYFNEEIPLGWKFRGGIVILFIFLVSLITASMLAFATHPSNRFYFMLKYFAWLGIPLILVNVYELLIFREEKNLAIE